MTNDLRLVLKSNVTRDDISGIAWQEDWELFDIIKQDEHNPFRKIWVTRNEQSGIHYIEDFLLELPYLEIKGENQEKLGDVIRSKIGIYDLDELHADIQNSKTSDQLIAAIYRLGAALYGDYNAELFHDFEHCFSHPDHEVRKAGIFASIYVGWKEFKEPLERLRDEDPDESVKKFATTTLGRVSATRNW
jgi:hypothetical protein